MTFLLTNDDGIDHPGMAALQRAMSALGSCVVVAPDRHLSGCSHQVTVDRPLALAEAGERRHHVDGTPVDCTRLGLSHVAPQAEWVVAGINEGGNLGADVYHSGTVAAVREAALLGRRGIAISHYRRRRTSIDWQRAARWTEQVVKQLVTQDCPAGCFWNVNLPHPEADDVHRLPEVVSCALDPNPLPVQFRVDDGKYQYFGRYQDRARSPGFDVDVCFSGQIAVTLLRLN